MNIHRQSMISRSILQSSDPYVTHLSSRSDSRVTDTQIPVNHSIEIPSSSQTNLTTLFGMKSPSMHLSDTFPSSQEHSTSPSTRKVTKVDEIIVRIYKDNSECFITCILDLPDSRYLFIDCNNRAVKIFGEDYTFQESLGLSVAPYWATLVSNTEIALTLPDKKKIQFLELKRQLRKTRTIRTRLKCWGIVAHGDQLAFTTGVDEHSVLILDRKGREIRTIRLDNYRDLELLDLHMISTNRDKTILYVSYWRGKTLVSYFTSNNGALSYTGQKLLGPSGTDTDREGNKRYDKHLSEFVLRKLGNTGKLLHIPTYRKKARSYAGQMCDKYVKTETLDYSTTIKDDIVEALKFQVISKTIL